jgi:acetate kinase
METILVVNAGSSSLKFQVFGIEPGQSLKRLIKGQVDGIGNHPRLRAASSDGASVVDHSFAPDAIPDLSSALHEAGAWLRGLRSAPFFAAPSGSARRNRR